MSGDNNLIAITIEKIIELITNDPTSMRVKV